MKPDLIAKLAVQLERPVSSEPHAMYIMVEIRKLLDITKLKADYPGLLFHCDWAVHAFLERSSISRDITAFFESIHAFTNDPDPGKLFSIWTDRMNSLIGVETLQAEMRTFLRSQGLPTEISDKRSRWTKFMSHYAGIIEDCPLIAVAQSECIEKVVIKKVASLRPGVLFEIAWEPLFKTGFSGPVYSFSLQFRAKSPPRNRLTIST